MCLWCRGREVNGVHGRRVGRSGGVCARTGAARSDCGPEGPEREC